MSRGPSATTPPGELMNQMVRTMGDALKLPWTAMAWFAGAVSNAVDGVRRGVGRGVDAAVATVPAAAAPETAPNETESQPDNPTARQGGTDKETEAMSDLWNNDDKIQLFQYTLVTVERGCERILEYDQRLVRDPLTEEEFKSQVIADYVSEHRIPVGAANNLRVAVEHLATWHKRPLHAAERQLRALDRIAHSLGGDHHDPCEPHELRHAHGHHEHGHGEEG